MLAHRAQILFFERSAEASRIKTDGIFWMRHRTSFLLWLQHHASYIAGVLYFVLAVHLPIAFLRIVRTLAVCGNKELHREFLPQTEYG